MNLRRAVAACAALVALGRPAAAQDSGTVRTAVITYLTSTSAYIDAGREAGLEEGAAVQVVRGTSVIATLKVAFLSSRQAACDIVTETVAIVVGDSVRFRVASAPRVESVAAVPTPRQRAGSRSTLHGRIGAHYLVMAQSGGAGFTQPSVDVRVDGRPLPGSAFGVALDVRARRTVSGPPGGSTIVDGHARAYQLATYWNRPSSPARVTVGRQMAPAMASVGLFDGATAEVNTTQWSAGLFGGTLPAPHDLGFSTDIVEGGAYLQRHSPRDARGRQWSATLGLSGSYENGQANREFALLQASYSSRRVMTLLSQEIDYYRPWKRATGMPAVAFTSTLATMRYRLSDAVDLHGGFDNRQNVLLYRDVVNPVTTFDDAFRQGIWAGAAFRFARRYSGGLELRRSSGATSGSAGAYTVSFGADRPAGFDVGLRARGTYYHGPLIHGWLYSAALSADPAAPLHVEVSGGARIEHDPRAIPEGVTVGWLGLDLDVSLARAWYVLLSGSVEHGGVAPTSQVYTGLSVRF